MAYDHNEAIRTMTFASVHPHYLAKAVKKGGTVEQLYQIIEWLTGFDKATVLDHVDRESTFEEFFAEATINPNARLITGVICGYRVEEIENPLTQKARYLDKLVDELGRGKKFENILRKPRG